MLELSCHEFNCYTRTVLTADFGSDTLQAGGLPPNIERGGFSFLGIYFGGLLMVVLFSLDLGASLCTAAPTTFASVRLFLGQLLYIFLLTCREHAVARTF